MENILRERARAAEDAKRIRKRRRRKEKIAYTLNGKKMRNALPIWKRFMLALLIMIVLLLGFIYIPALFYKTPVKNNLTPITPDATAIKGYVTYLKDHPDADFDHDGLPNVKETEYETDPWKLDTDGDGVSDYAELFVTETSPVQESDVLIKEVMKQDEIKGNTLGTPYKIDEVICWPDSYMDKAHGAVIRTLRGYKFCGFNGWVRFPEKKYVYEWKDGYHQEMEYKGNEEAYRVTSEAEVVLYDEPLIFVNRLEIPFMETKYLKDEKTANILERLLPDQGGYVRCRRIAKIDTEKREEERTEARLRQPLINEKDVSRFGNCASSLDDLLMIYETVEKGECVAASLYSGNTGEIIAIVYGYTENGDLLLADQNLNPVGELEISIQAERILNAEGDLEQISWYEWKGLGFDSRKYGDRINYFASTITSVEEPEIDEETEENREEPLPLQEPEEEKQEEEKPVITFSLP